MKFLIIYILNIDCFYEIYSPYDKSGSVHEAPPGGVWGGYDALDH